MTSTFNVRTPQSVDALATPYVDQTRQSAFFTRRTGPSSADHQPLRAVRSPKDGAPLTRRGGAGFPARGLRCGERRAELDDINPLWAGPTRVGTVRHDQGSWVGIFNSRRRNTRSMSPRDYTVLRAPRTWADNGDYIPISATRRCQMLCLVRKGRHPLRMTRHGLRPRIYAAGRGLRQQS